MAPGVSSDVSAVSGVPGRRERPGTERWSGTRAECSESELEGKPVECTEKDTRKWDSQRNYSA